MYHLRIKYFKNIFFIISNVRSQILKITDIRSEITVGYFLTIDLGSQFTDVRSHNWDHWYEITGLRSQIMDLRYQIMKSHNTDIRSKWLILDLRVLIRYQLKNLRSEIQMTDFRMWISYQISGSQMTDIRSQKSNFRPQITGYRSQTTDLRSQVSRLRSQISGLRSQISNLRSQV